MELKGRKRCVRSSWVRLAQLVGIGEPNKLQANWFHESLILEYSTLYSILLCCTLHTFASHVSAGEKGHDNTSQDDETIIVRNFKLHDGRECVLLLPGTIYNKYIIRIFKQD